MYTAEIYLNTFAAAIAFAAAILMYVSNKRFLSKEFKKTVNWIMITSAIFFAAQVSKILESLLSLSMETAHILRAVFAILVGLGLIKTAYEINKFSKVFGFAETGKKFAEAFMDTGKRKVNKNEKK